MQIHSWQPLLKISMTLLEVSSVLCFIRWQKHTSLCTTPPSTLLAITGEILLRLDAICDPLRCSLKDSGDLVSRPEEPSMIWNFIF